MKKIILASSSPRRAELLKQAGLEFSIMVSEVDETPPPDLAADALVELLALRKANAVAARLCNLYCSCNMGFDRVCTGYRKECKTCSCFISKVKNFNESNGG
jgi:predicted house-cleaning NTP pyrophosphatase (Maf/HAM1 superfamily)